MTLDFAKIKESTFSFLKKLGNLAILAICLGGGFAGGFFYNNAMTHIKPKAPSVLMLKTTSVAIDESDNLIILDKKTGDYSIYSDSVGIAVFNLYAHRMVSNIAQNNTK